MAETPVIGFDEQAVVFADYGLYLQGYIRYKITQRNLEPFTGGKRKLKVLDVGGGHGPDTAMLAEQGHHVTMLEPSEKQRAHASRRFNFFLTQEERKRIVLRSDTLDALPASARFDLVLLHGVAMYQKDPGAFIRQAASHVKRNGLISVVEKGYYGVEARLIRDQNFKGLRRLHSSKPYVMQFGHRAAVLKSDDIEQVLADAGMKVLQWTGIRVASGPLDPKVTSLTRAQLAAILEAEYEQGRHPGIRHHGQMLHFIARKK